jgi:CheY-like chemotaxis protein
MSARILVIEDDPDFLSVVSYLLTANGYTLLTARDGREGLEKAQKEQPDLILTDLMLPQLNGYEICSMLKQDLRYRGIPVIVSSATKIQQKDKQLAKDCGADAFILKTLEPKKLLEKVRELLAVASRPDAAAS